MTMMSRVGATFLIIVVGGQKLAIDTVLIQEILDPLPETRVPSARPFVPKVVNIRGRVVPLMRINDLLRLGPSERTVRSRLVLVQIDTAADPISIALLADAVDRVAEIPADTSEPLSRADQTWPVELLAGLYRDDDEFVIVPDLEKIITTNINPDPKPQKGV